MTDGTRVTSLPVLYSFRRCPYAMRARLALAVSVVPFELREITLRDKPSELLAASPKGTVPVLMLADGTVMDESLTIMQWALAQYDPGSWLCPTRGTADNALALIAGNDGVFKHHLDRYKYPHRFRQEFANPRAEDTTAFALCHRAGYLGGTRTALADMALLPFVRQCAHTSPIWFAAQPWPKLQQWLADFEASALYEQVMEKHEVWQSLLFQ